MNEEWRDIEGYEGLYQINKNGEVRSLPHYTKCAVKRNLF